MKPRLSEQKINQIREMKEKGIQDKLISLKCGVSTYSVYKYTRGCITNQDKIDSRFKFIPPSMKQPQECHTYNFNELPLADQKRYMSLVPPVREQIDIEKAFV
jgi:hypothetical protein